MAENASDPDDDEEAWGIASERADVIRSLLDVVPGVCRSDAVAAAASELGVSRAGLYRLVARYRTAGVTSSLLPTRRGRPKGSHSLDRKRETIIAEEIDELLPEAGTTQAIRSLRPDRREVPRDRCQAAQLADGPCSGPQRRCEAQGAQAAGHGGSGVIHRGAGGVGGRPPLDMVQIDHTQVDVIVVDPENRQSEKRPWLTLAIDIYSRMVLGYHLSLDSPSAISVGLCLLNAVFDKSALLAERDIDVAWPSAGLPRALLVDNAAEFHSRTFLRGCREHGIRVEWRPPGAPHYGGHIERLIGTQMGAVHVSAGKHRELGLRQAGA